MTANERLKSARDSLGVNQADFGKPLDLSQANVRDLESGKVKFSTLHALAIEKIHGISAEWLLSGIGEMNRGSAYPLAEGFKTAEVGSELKEDFVYVPRYNIDVSTGPGAVVHSEQVVDHLAFRSDWVRNALGLTVSALVLVNVIGDSMEPTLSSGDLILVDTNINSIGADAIYVLRYDGELRAKRIQRLNDGSVLIKSDNTKYGPEPIKGDLVDGLDIVGRVVWCGRRM